MLDVQKMIDSAQEALGWPYASPGSNNKSGIDCSGLFVKMYRDQGAKIAHGSNSIFHEYCSETGKIESASQLKPGMAVFKCKAWTDADKSNKWYGKEPGNLSHIGIVISGNPLRIIHASSEAECVTTDTKIGKWKYWGKLKDVSYSGGEGKIDPDDPDEEPYEALIYATVYSDNRKPVKLRAKPSTSCKLYDDVNFGSIVEVVEQNIQSGGENWSKVNYRNRIGWYMMSKFLLIDENSVPDIGGSEVEGPPPVGVSVTISGITMAEAKELQKKYPQAEIIAG